MRLVFNEEGLLPPGDYVLTIADLKTSILVQGPTPKPKEWDALWRGKLVDNLEMLAKQLWQVGVQRIFINGSFVEAKGRPNDIDGYFECDFEEFYSGKLAEKLNALDPGKVWTWDFDKRTATEEDGRKYLPMWHRYRIELYVDYGFSVSGIRNAKGLVLPFAEAFRQHKSDFKPKGIVCLIPESLRIGELR